MAQPGYYPPPIPVQPIDDPSFVTGGRPRWVSTIGIMSIVLACLSLIVNLMVGLASLGMMTIAAASQARATALAARPPSSPADSAARVISPDGMGDSDRAIVIEGLSVRRRLTDARRQQIDALLADSGQKI